MKHTYQDRLNSLLKKPAFLASEAREMGIHPSKLSYYVKKIIWSVLDAVFIEECMPTDGILMTVECVEKLAH